MDKATLLAALHKLYRKDKWIHDLFQSIGWILKAFDAYATEIGEQNFIDTATWGLAIMERDLGIIPKETEEERRREIIWNYQTRDKISLQTLKEIAEQRSSGNVQAAFLQGVIFLEFSGNQSLPENLNDFFAEIEKTKPAHLPFRTGVNYPYASQLYFSLAFRTGKTIVVGCRIQETEYEYLTDENGEMLIDNEYSFILN